MVTPQYFDIDQLRRVTLKAMARSIGRNTRLALSLLFAIGVHLGILLEPIEQEERAISASKIQRNTEKLEATIHSISNSIKEMQQINPHLPAPEPLQDVPDDAPPRQEPNKRETTASEPVPEFGPMLYLPAKYLDVRPKVIRDIPADIPELTAMHTGSTFIATLWINAAGTVDIAWIDQASLPLHIQEVMLRHLEAMTFRPGTKFGVPVPTEYKIEVMIAARGHTPPPNASSTNSQNIGQTQTLPRSSPLNSEGSGKLTPSAGASSSRTFP